MILQDVFFFLLAKHYVPLLLKVPVPSYNTSVSNLRVFRYLQTVRHTSTLEFKCSDFYIRHYKLNYTNAYFPHFIYVCVDGDQQST